MISHDSMMVAFLKVYKETVFEVYIKHTYVLNQRSDCEKVSSHAQTVVWIDT